MTYIEPVLSLLICLFLLGLNSRFARWCGNWKRVSIIAVTGLFLWSWPPVSWLVSGTLEWWYPVAQFPDRDAEAIVVFAGGLHPSDPSQPRPLVDTHTYLRTQHAAWLHRNWRPLPVVASGGPIGAGPEKFVVSNLMEEVLRSEGIPAEMIWTERQSTSTYENALHTANLLRKRGIRKVVLVSEAYHMLRAERCLRKQGLTVIPAPCCFRTQKPPEQWKDYFPRGKTIDANENCLHEWVGLAWYWVRGRI